MNTIAQRGSSQPLLLALAVRFDGSEPPLVDGWVYRRDIGAWVDADATDALMVTGTNPPKPNPNQPPKPAPPPAERPKPRPASKKYDHETGEDLKGP